MALTYHFDPEPGLVVLVRTHHPTFDEWSATMDALLSDPQFTPGMSILDDRRSVTTVPSREEVERTAAWIRRNHSRFGAARWAVVLDAGAPAVFGMARVKEFLTDQSGVGLRSFTDMASARALAIAGAEIE